MDVLFVDVEAITFYYLVFLLTVRLLCYRTAGDALQTLLAQGSPAVAEEQ